MYVNEVKRFWFLGDLRVHYGPWSIYSMREQCCVAWKRSSRGPSPKFTKTKRTQLWQLIGSCSGPPHQSIVVTSSVTSTVVTSSVTSTRGLISSTSDLRSNGTRLE